MDRPPPAPRKLLDSWMEWESGETTPGRVMSQLKTGGLRDLLEAMVAGGGLGTLVAGAAAPERSEDAPDATSWSPVV